LINPKGVADPNLMPDLPDMFDQDAPWSKAASGVQVFKTTSQFIARAPESLLAKMFADLKRRNIGLAVAGLMLTDEGTCGHGVEGYGGNTMDIVASRIRSLGGDLRYVAMDEPLWFGHEYSGPGACHSSLTALADDVAAKVRRLKTVFPDVEVGDVEPVGLSEPKRWVDEIVQWTETYHRSVGQPLAFFHADISWHGPWKEQLQEVIARAHSVGIKVGIIYNGNGDDESGDAWTQHAEERFVMVERQRTLIPDQAVLQTWMRQPTRMMPETQPGTMTNLVLRYHSAQTVLAAQRVGLGVEGSLTDESHHPVTGATIEIVSVADRPMPLRRFELSGTVPPSAETALVGLRINTECNCAGLADVGIGEITYADKSNGQTHKRRLVLPPANVRNGRVYARPDQVISVNSEQFSVVPLHAFSLEVPMDATYDSTSSGYVTIIFFGHDGKGVLRKNLAFQPRSVNAGSAVTDSAGHFAFRPKSEISSGPADYIINFAGNDTYRPTSMHLPQ
jgi:hypothetical protein